MADGQHAGTRLKTIGELVDLWIERRVASDKPISPDTVEDYRRLIAKKIKPALGGKRLHTITPASLTPSTTTCAAAATPRPQPAQEPEPRLRRSLGARTRARLPSPPSPPRATGG